MHPDQIGEFVARQTRLALLEAAVLSQLRGAVEDGYDGVTITASSTAGQTVIDVEYMQGGRPMAGESL